jgi:phosphoribosylformylglycinamidine synthase subunit PurQ / glutaminase
LKSAVVLLPGLNRDRDMIAALTKISGKAPATVWQTDTEIPDVDLIVIPGGFSYGDYLRCGAIAARMPVMRAVAEKANAGTLVIGVCNGFQILVEAGLLPGALMRNQRLQYRCESVHLVVDNADTVFTRGLAGRILAMPISHGEGKYYADVATLAALRARRQIVFRYADAEGRVTNLANPNGSLDNIAGVVSEDGNILGLMPHPERAAEPATGGTDGLALFHSLLGTLVEDGTFLKR